MVTKRTPIHRDTRRVITPRALQLFALLRQTDDKEKWWAIHSELHDELHCTPWQWPCVSDPRARNPFPEDCYAAEQWRQERIERPEAVALWIKLERLTKEGWVPAGAARRTRSRRLPHP